MKVNEEQLKAINKISIEELKEDDIYAFRVKAIGDNLIKDREMKIGKKTLEMFVKQAKKGVPLMLNHSWASFTDKPFSYGRSFDAELKEGDNEENAVYIDFYIVKDITLNGQNTNDIIQSVKSSTLSDVSIGFRVNDAKRTEETKDGKDDGYYEITDAELFEVSLVFSPAYKGAKVQKYSDDMEDVFFLSGNGDVLNGAGGELLKKIVDKKQAKIQDDIENMGKTLGDDVADEIESEDENIGNEETKDETAKETEKKEIETEEDVIDITDVGGHYYSIDDRKFTASELKMLVNDAIKYRNEVIEFAVTEAIKVNPDVDIDSLKLGFEIMSCEQILVKGNAYKDIANMDIPFGRKTESDNSKVVKNDDYRKFKL